MEEIGQNERGGEMCVLVPISNIGFIHLLVAELCSGLN